MAGPFYQPIKGTTAGAPGTGAFTPNAASSGFLAWSTVPTGWWGMVRYEDGTAWELAYSYWNGTTLSRSATQEVSSSTGSLLTLTASATAALIADSNRVGIDQTSLPARGWIASPSSSATPTPLGKVAMTVTGTAGAGTIASTNFLTRQPRHQSTSVTTANGQAGWTTASVGMIASATAGTGGWAFGARFGCSALPAGPRWFCGVTSVTMVANVGEPSALVANVAVVGKDSADTNLQIMTNDASGSATKIDTGIALVANAFYEIQLWSDPGSLTVFYLLVRLDTGAILYGSTATDVPVAGALLFEQMIGGLSATIGTAMVAHFGHMLTRKVF